MNLRGLLDTVRNALGQGGKATSPAPSAAPRPAAPTPRPVSAAPPAPISAPVPAPVEDSAAKTPALSTTATLVRSVRAGGQVLPAGTAVRIVTIHGKGSAYTVQFSASAAMATIEGGALRIG